MKRVYICSPLRGDPEKNIIKAQGYCREALTFGVIPIAPHVYFTQFLDDSKPDERAIGMKLGRELLKDCSEVWVYGIENPSEGMRAEIALATELGIPVRDAVEVYSVGARELDATSEKKGQKVTINIPGFRAMSRAYEHLNREPFSIEVDADIIIGLAEQLKTGTAKNLIIGGGEIG